MTFFGLVFTPVFYVVCRWLATLGSGKKVSPATGSTIAATGGGGDPV